MSGQEHTFCWMCTAACMLLLARMDINCISSVPQLLHLQLPRRCCLAEGISSGLLVGGPEDFPPPPCTSLQLKILWPILDALSQELLACKVFIMHRACSVQSSETTKAYDTQQGCRAVRVCVRSATPVWLPCGAWSSLLRCYR
jgi:hypothetical protein